MSMVIRSQKKDYTNYHKNINKAEEFFFVKNNVDSCIFYYDKVFSEYDFIFVKDLVNASQIAFFKKKEYKKYIILGFKQGLKIEHLKQIALFKSIYSNLLNDKKLQDKFVINRKIYLKKIDYKYLDWIYKITIEDQKSKNLKDYDSSIIIKTILELKDSIKNKGFPGERLIGISDSVIFKAIGKPYLDLKKRIKNDKSLNYITSDDEILAPKWPEIILVHNFCSYNLLKEDFKQQIKEGNIHPRDVGLIYDNSYRVTSGLFPSYCGNVNLKGVYKLNLFVPRYVYEKADLKLTNQMRSNLNIVSVEVDNKKKEYEINSGFKLFWGFWGCR